MRNPARTLILSLTASLPLDLQCQVARTVIDWQYVLALATRHDIIPLLHRSLNAVGDAVPSGVREQVRAHYAAVALHALQLENERQRLTVMFLASGIPVIPWKGPVLAEQLYGDVSLRSCIDLDLLVPPDQAWRALQVLLADGYTPGFELPEQRWLGLKRAVNHLGLAHSSRDTLVELHWALFLPMQVLPFDLAAHWQKLMADGIAREGRLDVEETLVLLCAHGSKHCWEKLKWVMDIDRLVRRSPELDWTKAVEIAERMGSRRALLLGLALARDACALPLPPPVEALLRADAVVARLAAEVRAGWFTVDSAQRNVPGEYLFHLRSRERLSDQFLWVIRQLCAPRQADWQLFPLGSYCYPLFYLQRPLRMMWKWLVRPVFNR